MMNVNDLNYIYEKIGDFSIWIAVDLKKFKDDTNNGLLEDAKDCLNDAKNCFEDLKQVTSSSKNERFILNCNMLEKSLKDANINMDDLIHHSTILKLNGSYCKGFNDCYDMVKESIREKKMMKLTVRYPDGKVGTEIFIDDKSLDIRLNELNFNHIEYSLDDVNIRELV